MTEHRALLFLVIGSLLCPGALLVAFVVGVRPLLGSLAFVGASLLWSVGIRRHPEPVPQVERVIQKASCVAPLAYLLLVAARCARGFLYSALPGGAT